MDLPGLAQCTIRTPKFTLTVNHVSGAEQAALFPNVEAWAAKFTWYVLLESTCDAGPLFVEAPLPCPDTLTSGKKVCLHCRAWLECAAGPHTPLWCDLNRP